MRTFVPMEMFLGLVKMQLRGSMPAFAGAPYQRGYGLGHVMKTC